MSWGGEGILIVALLVLVWQLAGMHDTLKSIRDSLRNSENKSNLAELEKIREQICCEFEETPTGLKLTRWGLKDIAEGIREDLKEIQKEIRSK